MGSVGVLSRLLGCIHTVVLRACAVQRLKNGTLGSTASSGGGHFFMTSLDDDSRADMGGRHGGGPATSVPSSPEMDEY